MWRPGIPDPGRVLPLTLIIILTVGTVALLMRDEPLAAIIIWAITTGLIILTIRARRPHERTYYHGGTEHRIEHEPDSQEPGTGTDASGSR